MFSRRKKAKSLKTLSPLKSRRTSLKVNLSYTSNLNSLSDDDDDDDHDRTNASLTSYENHLTKTAQVTEVEKSEPPLRWNLSTKKKSVDAKQTPNTSKQNIANLIKPSFVKMIRLTSTPVISRSKKIVQFRADQDELVPSESTKLSSALEGVRFPLTGEILSPNASIIMETSMDMTEVQGAVMVNLDATDSSEVIEDTEIVDDDDEHRLPTVIIPDSEQDSINTVQTSLNVNTSLDSRFSLMPSNSLYDPDKSENNNADTVLARPASKSLDNNVLMKSIVTTAATDEVSSSKDVEDCRVSLKVNTSLDSRFSLMQNNSLYDPKANENDKMDEVLPNPISQSSEDNVAVNCIVTAALIHHKDSSNDSNNYRKNVVRETNLETDRPRQCQPDTQSSDEDYTAIQKERNKDPNTSILNFMSETSSTEASSLPDQEHRDHHPKKADNEDSVIKPIKKGKKRLMPLCGSEMVDLSPVTVTIGREKRIVTKKRSNKRNKTAKKVVNTIVETANKPSHIYTSSEDDAETADPLPTTKPKKRVRKIKSKKIVIKKMADIHLWDKINRNNRNPNKSFEDISSALGRTSLDDFAPKCSLAKHKQPSKKPKLIIVATGLPIEQKILVKSAVTALGSAKLEKIVTRNTTHVVSNGARTVNLLRGMIRGCWLVDFEWISKCREAGKWIDAEKFEITSFSKAVQDNRKEKQLFGAAYVSELFLACGLIHIQDETSTPAEILKELVRIAGGRVTTEPEEAKIIVGRGGLKEVWILDSITSGELQPFDQYYKKKKNAS